MKLKNEVKLLKISVIVCIGLTASILMSGATKSQINEFKSLNVQRLNIVEADGTVKMVITNTDYFPNGDEKINGRILNRDRKKRSGMLFFNEDGIEAGGFIYDGRKTERGHSAGMSLTFDQYNGDQVLQLLTTDKQRGDKRIVRSGLAFNDRAMLEEQGKTDEIMLELKQIKDKAKKRERLQYYKDQGLIGGASRILLGKTGSRNNGLFLFAQDGTPRASFYIDKNDQVKLEVLNSTGDVVNTWPAVNN